MKDGELGICVGNYDGAVGLKEAVGQLCRSSRPPNQVVIVGPS